jgi:glyceraldehyde-3-phosphate dehydrogenase (NAD(P))
VIPENVDAIRAIFDAADAATSMQRTDAALGVGIRGDPAGFLGAGGVTAGVPQQER